MELATPTGNWVLCPSGSSEEPVKYISELSPGEKREKHLFLSPIPN